MNQEVEDMIDKIELFVEKLPLLKIGGLSFEKEFLIEGHRLWWFYKMRFLRQLLPIQFDNFRQMAIELISKEKQNRTIDGLKVFLLRKLLSINEFLKFQISKTTPGRESLVKDLLFSVHTNAVLGIEKGEVRVDRIQRVIDYINTDESLSKEIVIIDPISKVFSWKLRGYPNLFYNYIDKEIKMESKRLASKLNKKWRIVRNEIRPSTKEEEEIYDLLLPALDFFYSKEMIYLVVRYYETYKKIINDKKIRGLVVYACGGVIERCAIAAAETLLVPSFHISHGLGSSNLEWDYPSLHYWLVYSDLFKEHLIKLKAPEENVIVTGPVFLENYDKYKKEKKDSKKKTILFLSNTAVEDNIMRKKEYFSLIKKYMQELLRIKDTEIIIKPHPRELHKEEYQNIINNLKTTKIKVRDSMEKEFLLRLMSESDAVVGFFSTTLIEANILDKPSLLINLYPKKRVDKYGYFYNNTPAILKIDSDKNITNIVRKILYDKRLRENLSKKRKEMLRKYVRLDGKEASRAYQAIKTRLRSRL